VADGASIGPVAVVHAGCHPALAVEARVALTLQAVGGLTRRALDLTRNPAERAFIERRLEELAGAG
jgi:predicted RNA polymerase sigma factor